MRLCDSKTIRAQLIGANDAIVSMFNAVAMDEHEITGEQEDRLSEQLKEAGFKLIAFYNNLMRLNGQELLDVDEE